MISLRCAYVCTCISFLFLRVLLNVFLISFETGFLMDPLEYLHVRFHYNGEFLRGYRTLTYASGTLASSFIERDKLSFFELIGHLKDHLPELFLQF